MSLSVSCLWCARSVGLSAPMLQKKVLVVIEFSPMGKYNGKHSFFRSHPEPVHPGPPQRCCAARSIFVRTFGTLFMYHTGNVRTHKSGRLLITILLVAPLMAGQKKNPLLKPIMP